METIIREANVDDIPDIIPIWLEFMNFLEERNPDYWQMKGGKDAFAMHLDNSISEPQTLVTVSEVDGTLVAFCLAYIEKLPEWFGAEKIGIIRYLAVAKEHRQEGVGHGLVSYMLDWFRDNGIERVEVYVLNGIPASSFWDKQGFKLLMDRRFLKL